MSDLTTLRRIAERGLKKAQDEESEYIDLFQHLLDEIERTKISETDKLLRNLWR